MNMDRKRFHRRVSHQSRSSNAFGSLNPDSGIIDEEHPLWWNELENNTMVARQSAPFHFAEHTANYLDSNSQLDISTASNEWWEKLEKSKRISGNKIILSKRTNIHSDIHDAETNEENSSEISEEDNIKRRKPILSISTRSYGSDNFSRILSNSSFAVESEPAPTISRRSRTSLVSFLSDDKLLKHKRQLPRNKRRVKESTGKNIYDNLLNDESTTAHNSVEKSVTLRENEKRNLSMHSIDQQNDSKNKDNSHNNESMISKLSLSSLKNHSEHLTINASEIVLNNEVSSGQTGQVQSGIHKSKRISGNKIILSKRTNVHSDIHDAETNEENSSEISEEDNIKRRKPILSVSTRSYGSDNFSRILSNSSFVVESEPAPTISRRSRTSLVSFLSDDELLKHKRQLPRNKRRVKESTDKNIYDDLLNDESTTAHNSVEKSVTLRENEKSNLSMHPIDRLNGSKNKDNSHNNESMVSKLSLSPLKNHSEHLTINASETVLNNEISSSQAGQVQSGIHEYTTDNSILSMANSSQQNNSTGGISVQRDHRFLKLQAILQQTAKHKDLAKDVSTDAQMSLKQSTDETPSADTSILQVVRKSVTSRAKNTLSTVQIEDTAYPTLHSSLHNATSLKRSSHNEFVDQSVVPKNSNVIFEGEQSQIQKDDINISETQTGKNYSAIISTSNSAMDIPLKRSKVSANDKSRHNLLQTSNVQLETEKDTNDTWLQDISEKAASSNELCTKDDAKSVSDGKKQKVISSQTKITPYLQISHNKKIEVMVTELQKRKRKDLTTLKNGVLDTHLKRVKEVPSAMQKLINRNVNLLRSKKGKLSKNIGETPAKQSNNVHKAYIVNGVVYKRPKLPRPAYWVTNHLYRHLWKCMEPTYKNSTRIRSEKFVKELSAVVALTVRRKKYENYNTEVEALMKEMARTGIINTRNDFYLFCQEFLPYDFRIKVVPTYIPGTGLNIPYNPNLLHTPIIGD